MNLPNEGEDDVRPPSTPAWLKRVRLLVVRLRQETLG